MGLELNQHRVNRLARLNARDKWFKKERLEKIARKHKPAVEEIMFKSYGHYRLMCTLIHPDVQPSLKTIIDDDMGYLFIHILKSKLLLVIRHFSG